MPKRNDAIQNYTELIEDAKDTALTLVGDTKTNYVELFYETDLETIENGIKNLNELSSKCWLISAIALYSMVYDQQIYQQSGMAWSDYIKHSRERLGMDARVITEQLSSARFFIKYHEKLTKAGWSPLHTDRKILARAELAHDLSGDINATIRHICKDTFTEFKAWYSSYKMLPTIESPTKHEINRYTVEYSKGTMKINGIDAISVSSELNETDKKKMEYYIKKIADSLISGYEPAIIPVYDTTEANTLIRLRDKNRQSK